jgi:cobalt-zinc-cadmium efflux system protein
MLGSLGVLAAGAIIHFTGWKPIDPIIAVLIGLWVLPRTWVILKDSLNILLEGVPPGINTDAISEAILRVPGVSGLHDLHVWGVSTNRLLLTAHVARDTLPDITDTDVLSAIHKLLNEQFQIAHCTIQLEHTPCGSPDCHDQQNVH